MDAGLKWKTLYLHYEVSEIAFEINSMLIERQRLLIQIKRPLL